MKLNKWFLTLTLVFAIGFGQSNLLAKPSGGFSSSHTSSSGSHSSSSSSHSSSSSPKASSSSWGSSSPKSSSGWGTTSSKTSTSSPKGFTSSKSSPTVDTSAYSKAKSNGTTFTNKEAATSAFKETYSEKYTAKFTAEPKSRPTYIPSSYSDGGHSYNITYNVNRGGYGYHNALGLWIMYDIMADHGARDRVMAENNYYYDTPREGHPILWLCFGILIFITIVVLCARDA